jgi:PAS domain S-box-containing protein
MGQRFSLNHFSTRLLLGFVVLIGLTTLSAGVPAYLLTRSQLERQAWSQVDDARRTTQSFLTAEQTRLQDQLILFTERPTLQRLVVQELAGQPAVDLQDYLDDFMSQSGLDMLALCPASGAGDCLPTGQAIPDQEHFTLLDGRPAILAQATVYDDSSGALLATAVAGLWLDDLFLQQLAATTGVGQSMVRPDGTRLAGTVAVSGSQVALPRPAGERPLRQELALDDGVYYAAYAPLANSAGQIELLSEVALDVSGLVAAERGAFLILAVSTGLVALFGSLLSVWFVRQVNAPLEKLTATAEKISQGDLAAAVPAIDRPVEVRTLAAALQRSQASMLQALEERSEAGEWLNALLQSLVEGVATFDTAGQVTSWSEGASGLLGWLPDEAIGRQVNELFRLSDDEEKQFLEVMPPAGQKRQIGVLTRSGRPLILAITGSQLIPPGGDTVQVALVFRDVTEEEALRRLRSYFLANISHEFRTPLSTLNASMELLLDEQESFTLAEVRQLLKPTHVSLMSLQALIDNLLESSTIEAGQFSLRRRTFRIDAAIDSAVNIARPLLERRGQPLSLAEPSSLPEIDGDPARLTQVLVNLIINASKYSPMGRPIELQLREQPDALWVAVADRGPGIPPADRGRLFQSFVRLDQDNNEQYGIGLGLYVVKTIVEAHGGRVGVDDRPGGGSCFWFEIPIQSEEEA